MFSLSDDEECFDVPIINDDISEGTENFMLTFDIPDQDIDVTVSPRIFDVQITDDDEGKWINLHSIVCNMNVIVYYILGNSAGKVNAGVLIFFVTLLGWFLAHALHV